MNKVIIGLIYFVMGVGIIAGLSSCRIYQSPERHDFENEYPQYQQTALASMNNLRLLSCSSESLSPYASAARVIYTEAGQLVLSEYIVNNTSVLESDNFKGDFCIYEQSAH